MGNWIECTTVGSPDKPLLVNIDQIVAMIPEVFGTKLIMHSGTSDFVAVAETVHQLRSMIPPP